jgi:AcrR family transcriptional regulator
MSDPGPSRRPPGRPVRSRDDPGVREALLEAARALFSARDYRAVSLRQIAAEAGVSPAMVHYYFGDKTGLFDALLDATFSRLLARMREALAERGSADIGALLEILVGTIGAEPWIPRLMIREVLADDGPFRDRFIQRYASQVAAIIPGLVARGQEAGELRADLDPRLAFASLVGMTVFPFAARPVLERVLGLEYDEDFRRRFVEHTRRLFVEGAGA